MLFAADKYMIQQAAMFAYFQHGGHKPEVVISFVVKSFTALSRTV